MKKTGSQKNRSTQTSAFGTAGRVSHDASRFYNSRLYEGQSHSKAPHYHENPIPKEHLDRLYAKSSEQMDELPDNSVHLMVTSPPYNASKEYDEDLSLEEYLAGNLPGAGAGRQSLH
jgi:hypothetical protein